jgi:hypothetical protein
MAVEMENYLDIFALQRDKLISTIVSSSKNYDFPLQSTSLEKANENDVTESYIDTSLDEYETRLKEKTNDISYLVKEMADKIMIVEPDFKYTFKQDDERMNLLSLFNFTIESLHSVKSQNQALIMKNTDLVMKVQDLTNTDTK